MKKFLIIIVLFSMLLLPACCNEDLSSVNTISTSDSNPLNPTSVGEIFYPEDGMKTIAIKTRHEGFTLSRVYSDGDYSCNVSFEGISTKKYGLYLIKDHKLISLKPLDALNLLSNFDESLSIVNIICGDFVKILSNNTSEYFWINFIYSDEYENGFHINITNERSNISVLEVDGLISGGVTTLTIG